jgi:hypothetical protein
MTKVKQQSFTRTDFTFQTATRVVFAKTAKYAFAFSRRESPELCMNLPPHGGRGRYPKGERGMPGARCTRSRACNVVSTRVSHHGCTGTPGIPAREWF